MELRESVLIDSISFSFTLDSKQCKLIAYSSNRTTPTSTSGSGTSYSASVGVDSPKSRCSTLVERVHSDLIGIW